MRLSAHLGKNVMQNVMRHHIWAHRTKCDASVYVTTQYIFYTCYFSGPSFAFVLLRPKTETCTMNMNSIELTSASADAKSSLSLPKRHGQCALVHSYYKNPMARFHQHCVHSISRAPDLLIIV